MQGRRFDEGYRYEYPPVKKGGYPWNLKKKLILATGQAPDNLANTGISIVPGRATVIWFPEKLTEKQEKKLDKIFEDIDTVFDPIDMGGDVLVIQDMSEGIDGFKANMGEPTAEIWYTKSNDQSKKQDQIEIHFDRKLNGQERKKILETYASLARWK